MKQVSIPSQTLRNPRFATVAWKKAFLACGVLSSFTYVALNVFGAMAWRGYDSSSQTVSELAAYGSPSRSLVLQLGGVYNVFGVLFALGLWIFGERNRRLHIAAVLLGIYASTGVFAPYAAMHLRGAQSTITDTLHILLTLVTVILMMLSMGFAGSAFGHRFKAYSFSSMVLLLVFGLLTTVLAPNLQAGLATPLMGVYERINIGIFLLWIVMLAIRSWPLTERGG